MYQTLLKWCKDSEVIIASRLQVLGGVLVVIVMTAIPLLSTVNLSVFISDPRVLAAYPIVSGVVMELLRRYRAVEVVDPVDGSTTLAK